MPDSEVARAISISIASDKLLTSLPRKAEHRDPVVRDRIRQLFAEALVKRLRMAGLLFFRGRSADWHKTGK